MTGDAWIRATIAAAIVCYAAAEWLRFRRPLAWRAARLAWTAGAALVVLHSAAAFHVRHAWSHQHALASTASQTAAVTGLDWGGGLYANYAFIAVWVADAAWWWRSPSGYAARPPAVTNVLAVWFLFMFANGGIVFARGPVRWLGAACVGVAAWAWYFRTSGAAASSPASTAR